MGVLTLCGISQMHITDPLRTHTTVPHGWLVCSLRPILRTWKRSFSGPDERLTSGMQTFASRVANICNRGCNALRLSWEWLKNGLYVSDYQALRRRKIRAKRWRCLFLMIGSQESGIHKAHFRSSQSRPNAFASVSAESEAFRRCWENAKRKQKDPPV